MTSDRWLAAAPSRRGENTRRALLDSAEALFARNGYEGTSLAQIAQHRGFTTGAIYQHFSGKLELLIGLLQRYDEALRDALAEQRSLDGLFDSWFEVNRQFRGALRASDETISSEHDVSAVLRGVRRRSAEQMAEAVDAHDWIPDPRRHALEGSGPRTEPPVWAQVTTDVVSYLSLAERCGWIPQVGPEAATTLRVVLLTGLFTGGTDEPADQELTYPSTVRRSSRRMLSWSPAPGRVSPASTRGQNTVQRIQHAANEVFAESGLAGISMEDIAARTSMRAGTAYQYFTDKEDVFRSLQAAVEDELYETSLFPADEHGRLVVAPTYAKSLVAYRRNAGVYRAWRESLSSDRSQAAAWRKMFGGFLDQLRAIFEQGITKQLVSAELNPAMGAEIFSALVQQPMYVHVLHGWYDGCEDDDLARTIETMVRGDLVASTT